MNNFLLSLFSGFSWRDYGFKGSVDFVVKLSQIRINWDYCEQLIAYLSFVVLLLHRSFICELTNLFREW